MHYNFVVAKNGLIFDYFGWDGIIPYLNLISSINYTKTIIIAFIQPLDEIINATMITKLVADGKAIGKLSEDVSFLTLNDIPKAELEDKKIFEVSNEIYLPECQNAEFLDLMPFDSMFEKFLVIDTFSIDGNPEDCNIVSEI